MDNLLHSEMCLEDYHPHGDGSIPVYTRLRKQVFFQSKKWFSTIPQCFFENLQFNHLYLTVTKAPWFPLEKKLNNTQKNQNSVKSASIRPGLHSSRHSLSQSGSAGTTCFSEWVMGSPETWNPLGDETTLSHIPLGVLSKSYWVLGSQSLNTSP